MCTLHTCTHIHRNIHTCARAHTNNNNFSRGQCRGQWKPTRGPGAAQWKDASLASAANLQQRELKTLSGCSMLPAPLSQAWSGCALLGRTSPHYPLVSASGTRVSGALPPKAPQSEPSTERQRRSKAEWLPCQQLVLYHRSKKNRKLGSCVIHKLQRACVLELK